MSPPAFPDPTPLSPRQWSVLGAVTTRELVWGRRAVSHEIRHWKQRAARIVDGPIRDDAHEALTRKRGSTDGAALFWTLLPRRNLAVLKLLVAQELIWDFLDSVNERVPSGDNGRQLHRAIGDSLDPSRPIADYYRYHPWRNDGGFLVGLVETCRAVCRRLPSYAVVRPFLVREGERALVLGLNHLVAAKHRDDALRLWAESEFPDERTLAWFELTAAASTPVAVHVLLALAGEPRRTSADIASTMDAYFPWVSLATAMLDSYVDQAEDARKGNHSYLGHYDNMDEAMRRTHETIHRAARAVRGLPNGHRHAVIVSCMIAMYLSKDSARTHECAETTHELARAGGSLTCLLLPVLRAWRIRYAQQSA